MGRLRHREKKATGGRRQRWSYVAISQGTPRTMGDHQALGRGREDSSLALQREHGPDDSLI